MIAKIQAIYSECGEMHVDRSTKYMRKLQDYWEAQVDVLVSMLIHPEKLDPDDSEQKLRIGKLLQSERCKPDKNKANKAFSDFYTKLQSIWHDKQQLEGTVSTYNNSALVALFMQPIIERYLLGGIILEMAQKLYPCAATSKSESELELEPEPKPEPAKTVTFSVKAQKVYDIPLWPPAQPKPLPVTFETCELDIEF
jgi:hypothetical protein